MRYVVSNYYIFERRRAPRRIFGVLAFVFAMMLFVTWQNKKILHASDLTGIAITVLITMMIAIFSLTRMESVTKNFEQYAISIDPVEVKVNSTDWHFIVPANTLKTLIVYKSLFSRRLKFFKLIHEGGEFFTIPLENAEGFIQEFSKVYQNIPIKKKSKIFLNF